jgi:hypothetical protein
MLAMGFRGTSTTTLGYRLCTIRASISTRGTRKNSAAGSAGVGFSAI